MWPKAPVGCEQLLPPVYKTGPGRPKKLRIRGADEDGARKRKRGVRYRCTTCSSLQHNAAKRPSKTQDPDALKRKRKPPKGKGKSSTETFDTTTSNQNVDAATQNPAETVIDATQSQPEAAVDNFPTLFDEIPDEVIATLPDAVNVLRLDSEASIRSKANQTLQGGSEHDRRNMSQIPYLHSSF
ncbi:hypothetical protein QL285_068323 [Trifolium repens]|nr:hypothetical protein QL285_068323 [Trifolium repens]